MERMVISEKRSSCQCAQSTIDYSLTMTSSSQSRKGKTKKAQAHRKNQTRQSHNDHERERLEAINQWNKPTAKLPRFLCLAMLLITLVSIVLDYTVFGGNKTYEADTRQTYFDTHLARTFDTPLAHTWRTLGAHL